ncbi:MULTISPECIES: condensation domain-containing protein [Micromonospora]|uniref:condensation domain-containing protein n=1 Tax=Micromonospora TaxID=1873 RepID=UPI0021CA6103|nr:condensation domain-containing protein [Micromonospora sp. Mcm103]
MSYTEIPASIGQRLMWFLAHYRAETASVNCPAGFRIRGPLDPGKLAGTVDILMRRHESLRTTLHRRGRDLVQRVHEPGPTRVEWTELPAGAEAEVQRQYAEELRAPIAVEQAPVRWHAWRIGADDHVLCANMHHLVSDAWSCGVLINDVIALLGDGAPPAPVGWQYRQFSAWQHEQSASGQLRADHDYWAAKLDGMRVPDLPARRPGQGAPRPGLALHEFGDADAAALRAFAKAERTTLFPVMLGLYYLLLHTETGADDLAVASLFANRTRPEVQLTVGFFANMLVLRTRLADGGSFRDLLAATRRTVLDAVVHQGVPYQTVPVPALREAGGRVNDVVFQMLPDRAPDSWSPTAVRNGLEIDTFRPSQGLSRFGLSLTVIPRADRFDARLSYAEDQFEPAWAQDFVRRYAELAGRVLADPDAPLRRLVAAAGR